MADIPKKGKFAMSGKWPDIVIELDGERLDNVSGIRLELATDSLPELVLYLRPGEIDIDIETLRSLLIEVEGRLNHGR